MDLRQSNFVKRSILPQILSAAVAFVRYFCRTVGWRANPCLTRLPRFFTRNPGRRKHQALAMCATRIELMTNTMGAPPEILGNASDLSVEADLWAATANHEKPRTFPGGHSHNLDVPRDLP